jgi:hypothetical protein
MTKKNEDKTKDNLIQLAIGVGGGVIAPIISSVLDSTKWIVLLYSFLSILFVFVLVQVYSLLKKKIDFYIKTKTFKIEKQEYMVNLKEARDYLLNYLNEKEIFMSHVDFLINLVKERYHLIKPRDPNEKKGSWKESTEDLVAVVLKQSIIIEKDRIFLLKTKFKCPICKSDLSIRQPRNKVIIKCSKCDADIRYSRDALLIFKDERRYNILVSFPPRQRGWH